MKKATFVICALVALCLPVWAQGVTVTAGRIQPAASAPSSCAPNAIRAVNGTLYLGKNDGTCAPITTAASTNPGGSGSELQYRAGAASFGAVTGSSVSGANVTLGGTLTVTSNSATGFCFGPNGCTNPTVQFDGSPASAATGIKVTAAASGGGVTVAAIGGTNEPLSLTSKGTGGIGLGTTTPATGSLDIVTAENTGLRLTDATANGVVKDILVSGRHYLTAQPDVLVLYQQNAAADNVVFYGGGTALFNAATSLRFFTAANNTTTGGNERMRVAADGNVAIGSTTTTTARLRVDARAVSESAARFQAASGTAGGQELVGVYDGAGAIAMRVTAGGTTRVSNGGIEINESGGTHAGDRAVVLVDSGGGGTLYLTGGLNFAANGTDAGAALDLSLARDAANTLAQKNGNADQLHRTYAANNGYWERGSISELITLSTVGTTTDSAADLLPANSIIEAVTARITTTIATATDWSLGDATTANRFTAANSTLTAGTTSVGLRHYQGSITTDAAGPVQTSAAKLRITTTGTPSAGVLRITVYFRKFVAPTS